MGKRASNIVIFVTAVLLLGVYIGCSEDVFIGTPKDNKQPEVWLSSGPIEGDTTSYQIHFYWGGWDPDGEIDFFEFIVVDATDLGYGFNPEDTAGVEKWSTTNAYDSVISVTADKFTYNDTLSNRPYSRFAKAHTFFIRAVDLKGMRSEPVSRSFTAWTYAPDVVIEEPLAVGDERQVLGRVITFKWKAKDPIDDPSNTQEPDSVRYLWSRVIDTLGRYDETFNIVNDLNKNPWRYEKRENWSKWIWYRAEGDSGKATRLGDDEILENRKSHIFAVQAKDEAGAVTMIFDREKNVRQFIVSPQAGPLLTITEQYLGGFKFLGTNFRPEKRDLPPGVPLNFRWGADASSYGGEIKSYRYGWDVDDVNEPDDWDILPSPFVTTAPERKLYMGVHTFTIEVTDNTGAMTRGSVEINVVPFNMTKNLLWVDDFKSVVQDIPDKSHPPEPVHDEFWEGICARAEGWTTEDVYDCQAFNIKPPEITLIGDYKNIIWTFSAADDAWGDIVLFTPESAIGLGSQLTVNYLALFIAKGGHLWTLGRSERTGGLAAVLQPYAQSFPMSLRCEITGNRDGCEGDTSGVNSMPYKDYCISMLDKIKGVFRTGISMPRRDYKKDAVRFMYRDDEDPVTAEYPDLPEYLELSAEVTAPGTYFDPSNTFGPGGFTYVELYDPEYWMKVNFIESQPCFHPMYKIRTRVTSSPVDHVAAAIWLTKYEDVKPDGKVGVNAAARSVHFGFPLWFFDRESVDSIVEVIFREWQIYREPGT